MILSVLVAVQAGYVGLTLAQRIPGAFALRRRAFIAAAATTLSVGIWSMHFIGMLAIKTTMSVDYLVLPTLISFLVCILVTGLALYMASLRSLRMMLWAALVMGIGIAVMHYVGMMALNSSAMMTNHPAYVLASIALAISASGLALWLAFVADKRLSTLLGAVVFGFAVSGMHYIAMAGMAMHFVQAGALTESFISSDVLAIIVTVVSFLISAVFMLTLIPKDPAPPPRDTRWAVLEAASADVEPTAEPALQVVSITDPATVVPVISAMVPIEKNGVVSQIPASDIVSVHANAHYTYVFDGRSDLFCPMSISEVDERIAGAEFFRTHRSHIVGLRHVDRIEKSSDAAVAVLNSALRRTVPVARARGPQLREELTKFKARQVISAE